MLVAVRGSLIVPRGIRRIYPQSCVNTLNTPPIISSVSHPASVSWFMLGTIMALRLDAT